MLHFPLVGTTLIGGSQIVRRVTPQRLYTIIITAWSAVAVRSYDLIHIVIFYCIIIVESCFPSLTQSTKIPRRQNQVT